MRNLLSVSVLFGVCLDAIAVGRFDLHSQIDKDSSLQENSLLVNQNFALTVQGSEWQNGRPGLRNSGGQSYEPSQRGSPGWNALADGKHDGQPLPIQELEEWYLDLAEDCGSPDSPSLECSGVLLRGVSTTLAYLSWDPSPRAIELGSTSLSWLRQDHNFARLFSDNGFILYPRDLTPTGKNKTNEVLCSFPVNGYSSDRLNAGCGPTKGRPNDTDTCQNLGVTTPQEWLDRYENARFGGCGWNLTGQASDPARSFQTCLQTHEKLPMNYLGWNSFNELVMRVWPEGSGALLPIHSFYHIGDTLSGLVMAQSDQTRYYRHYNQKVPIVRIVLPTTKQGQATFSYSEDEQLAGKPNFQYDITFDNVPIGPKQNFTVDNVRFELTGDTSGVSDAALNPRVPARLAAGMEAGNITGRYVTTSDELYVEIPGFGLRNVTFDWGCRTFCFLFETMSRNETILYEDEEETGRMQFGRAHFQVTAPEMLQIMTAQVGTLDFVMDNLIVS